MLGNLSPAALAMLAGREVALVDLTVTLLTPGLVHPTRCYAMSATGQKGLAVTSRRQLAGQAVHLGRAGRVVFFEHVFAGLIPPDHAWACIAKDACTLPIDGTGPRAG